VLFSDDAARWARTQYGRVASLIRLTATGKAMIAKDRAKQRGASLKLDDDKIAENVVLAPSQEIGRQARIRRALDEAAALEARAIAAWNGDDIPCSNAAE
jgi:hypothetical protein